MTAILSMVLQQTAAQPKPSMLPFLIQFVAIIAIFWFLLIRPQQKKAAEHRKTLDALKAGDEIITDGGIIGTVLHIKEERVTIKTAENTRLVVLRQKIGRVLSPTNSVGEVH